MGIWGVSLLSRIIYVRDWRSRTRPREKLDSDAAEASVVAPPGAGAPQSLVSWGQVQASATFLELSSDLAVPRQGHEPWMRWLLRVRAIPGEGLSCPHSWRMGNGCVHPEGRSGQHNTAPIPQVLHEWDLVSYCQLQLSLPRQKQWPAGMLPARAISTHGSSGNSHLILEQAMP